MGVVTASSSAARTIVGLGSKQTQRPGTGRSLVVAFKSDKPNDTAIVIPQEKVILPVETIKRKRRTPKNSTRTDSPTCPLGVDYNEAAAKLESIYKLSPVPFSSHVEEGVSSFVRTGRQTKRSIDEHEENAEEKRRQPIVRNLTKKPRRLGLHKRLELKQHKEAEEVIAINRRRGGMDEQAKIQELVREYCFSSDLVAMNWSKMKIPPVLSSTEQAWLFKLVQPMKALLQVKKELRIKLGREPTDVELADFRQVGVAQVRKQMEVGQAARNKLIKHNLRLVLFMINKRFSDIANGSRFQDLCQEGANGLITAIDRFEPSKRSKLSTYSLFWIRHAIVRSMTVSSIIHVSFGLGSVRLDIQKAKMELMSQLDRKPTEEEIIQKVGITPKRYNEVMSAFKPILSLNSRHATTQEEWINRIEDTDGGQMGRKHALFRLALDDVLDSLKPKESLVIRQRYGLDGKHDRTLQEIAGNLNISKEMVRKYEVKALMKLKHPARLDYLRRYVA